MSKTTPVMQPRVPTPHNGTTSASVAILGLILLALGAFVGMVIYFAADDAQVNNLSYVSPSYVK